MIALAGFILFSWILYKPVYSLSESFFWSCMELAAVRDPNAHDAAVAYLVGKEE